MSLNYFLQRKRKPTTVVIINEDNQIQDGMNNNAKKIKTKKVNIALMSIYQYVNITIYLCLFSKSKLS